MMAKRNPEGGRLRTARIPSSSLNCRSGNANTASPACSRSDFLTQRLNLATLSPPNGSFSPNCSPRTSPGLLAGHYAGCKFTEPPRPSMLPKPPQHWMQQQCHVSARPYVEEKGARARPDVNRQLKVLLKVQA